MQLSGRGARLIVAVALGCAAVAVLAAVAGRAGGPVPARRPRPALKRVPGAEETGRATDHDE